VKHPDVRQDPPTGGEEGKTNHKEGLTQTVTKGRDRRIARSRGGGSKQNGISTRLTTKGKTTHTDRNEQKITAPSRARAEAMRKIKGGRNDRKPQGAAQAGAKQHSVTTKGG